MPLDRCLKRMDLPDEIFTRAIDYRKSLSRTESLA